MKNKTIIIRVVAGIIVAAALALAIFFMNNNNNSNDKQGNSNQKEDVKAIDNNDNYFIKVKGKTYKAGDKISNLAEAGIKPSEKVLTQKVNKNTYVIGAGSMYNEDDKNVCSVTPFNATDNSITVADAVIGGFEIGEYDYNKISQDKLDLDVEVAGGIKLGSSLEDVQKVFGETDSIFESESLGYKTYTYKSEEVYRKYEFLIDKNNKVAKISWQNLVFNK